MVIEVRGRITESGTLEVTLPAGMPPGDVTVRIEPSSSTADSERPYKALVEALLANPPTEPWGNLRDDEDVGEYIHRMRHTPTWNLDETDDKL